MNDQAANRVRQTIARADSAEKRTALTTSQSLVKWLKTKGLGHLVDAVLNFILEHGWNVVRDWLATA